MTFAAIALCALAIAQPGQELSADKPSVEARPNIIFFLTDDQRNDTLGCAGHPIIKTPTIDSLAERGVRFSNMFVSHSICWVSRTTLLNGMTARSFGRDDHPDWPRPDAITHLYPKLLKQAGYRTAHYGKFHVRMPKEFVAKDVFDEFKVLYPNPFIKTMPDGSKRHETEIVADHAIRFLKNQPKDQPFAINLWFNAAHAEDSDHRPGIGHYPWPKAVDGMYDDLEIPAPRLSDPEIFNSQPDYLKNSIHRDRFHWRWDTPEKYQLNMRAYFRMISGIDHAMSRVLAELKTQGLDHNTIIVYSADNGYYMGDRGFAGKWSHYEQSLRVPLIIYDPRQDADDARGKVIDHSAMNLDLPATFLSFADVPIPSQYQGMDLAPMVYGRIPKMWRQDMFFEHVTLRPNISWEGVRTRRFKYARYFDQAKNNEFLHDLINDPDELINLANDPDHAEILTQLRNRTDALVNQYGGPLPKSK
jgi:choline-sulfatase